MDLVLIFALLLTGFFISFLCSMVGLGGGVLFIPILILIYKLDANLAIGTSIFAMTLVTFSSTIGYAQSKNVDWKLALIYDVFDLPGIVLGAFLTTIIPLNFLKLICGIMICSIAGLIIFKKEKSLSNNVSDEDKPTTKNYNSSISWKGKKLVLVIVSSFLGGLVTGMVGMGGGTVDTTAMILSGVPINIAAGSSSLAMLFTNIVGLSTHIALGNIIWAYAIPLGATALIGAQIGSRLAPKLKPNNLKRILGSVALFSGLRLLFELLV